MLQAQEDRGEHELYYFDESGFSQSSSVPYAWSAIGKPWEVTAYSHRHRLNVLGFVSRKGKLVYHTTTESVTTETVIEAFDQLVAQKDPDAFAVVVLDNASMHRSRAFKSKILEWMSHRVHLALPIRLLARAELDRDPVATDQILLAALGSLSLIRSALR